MNATAIKALAAILEAGLGERQIADVVGHSSTKFCRHISGPRALEALLLLEGQGRIRRQQGERGDTWLAVGTKGGHS